MEIKAYNDTHVLSEKGQERAMALVTYFTHRHEIMHLFNKRPLGGIFAQDVDYEGKGKSLRPRETMEPLANHLSMAINLYKKKEAKKMVRDILSGVYDGKSVIVCWAHQEIRNLCVLLGMDETNVPKWPKERYDLTWIVHTEKRELQQFCQRLMYGDSEDIVALGAFDEHDFV
jgi:hypothetical protein